MRTLIKTCLKLLVVAALLGWLVHSDKLHLDQLKILVANPWIAVGNLAVWGIGSVLLGTFRWWLLLRGLGLVVSFFRALRLQLIGLFFNTTMPGAVGGDIIKAVYIIREQTKQSKTAAMLTVLLDRVVGLGALFVMAATAVLANPSFFFSSPSLAPLAIFIFAGLVGLLFGYAVVMYPFKDGRDPFRWLFTRNLPGLSKIHGIYDALRAYRKHPWLLLATVLISIVIQSGAVIYGLFLTRVLTGQTPDLDIFCTIYPLGVMTTALPLAPGGLGLGHVAFERLFSMVGLTSGANIFNVIVLGQLSLNLLGVIPYVLYRSSFASLREMEAEIDAQLEPNVTC
jgi:uncharacterized protein (TIRG00374 family)